MLIGIDPAGDSPDTLARIIQGLMTGMGFIGGGAILKGDGHVRGTATAASVWSTGAIGAAVATNRYEIAILLAIINWVLLQLFTDLKRHMDTPGPNPVGSQDQS